MMQERALGRAPPAEFRGVLARSSRACKSAGSDNPQTPSAPNCSTSRRLMKWRFGSPLYAIALLANLRRTIAATDYRAGRVEYRDEPGVRLMRSQRGRIYEGRIVDLAA